MPDYLVEYFTCDHLELALTPYTVFFDVPANLLAGLEAGVLERVGGIVRDSSSKQVVAWLREAPVEAAHHVPIPVQALLQSSAVGRSAMSVANIGALTTMVATGQILNFAMTAASLYIIMQRLDQLSDEIGRLASDMRANFSRDRDIRFSTALQAARDVFEADSITDFQDHAARSALDGLCEARQHLLTDFDEALDLESPHRLQMARHSLIRAMYAEVSRVRCYATSRGAGFAIKRLLEAKPIFEKATVRLVQESLGDKQALFLYKDVSAADLDRYFQIKRWVKSPNDPTSADFGTTVFTTINDLRRDFWNLELIQDDYYDTINKLVRRPLRTVSEKLDRLSLGLENSEIAIENYQHLLGFEIELRSMRLSFEEWQKQISTEELMEHGAGILVDENQLNLALERLESQTRHL
jgi:hypothetical protein